MRIRVAELLAERNMTAYQLSKESGGRISMSVAYRLAKNDWRCMSIALMDALCDVLKLDDTCRLFQRENHKRR